MKRTLRIAKSACLCVACISGCCVNGMREGQDSAHLSRLLAWSKGGGSLARSGLGDVTLTAGDVLRAKMYVLEYEDYRACLPLLVLRRQAKEVYAAIPEETKAKVLCSALVNGVEMNDWGHVGVADEAWDGEAALALLETGRSTVEMLKPLLDDRREALYTGSSDATVNRVLQCRRCDYAYRYISLMIGRQPAFSRSPAVRDEHIASLRQELGQ